jgi:tRNA threonylcarbamoyladenosine biosynthesis protein TsaE
MTFHAGPIVLASEDATTTLAACIAHRLVAGDCLLLSGSIGAGKTAFARALIRSRMEHPSEDVPSPTFTLVQTYQAKDVTIWHADLYRLTHPDEVLELGLEDAFSTSICLIEWPDRLGSLAPANAVGLSFEATPEGAHLVTLCGPLEWQGRIGNCLV